MSKISFLLLTTVFLLCYVLSFSPVAFGTSMQISNSTIQDMASNGIDNLQQVMIVERAKEADIVFGSISKGDKAYDPNPIYIDEKYFVTWLNNDSILHTVTSGSGIEDDIKGSEFDSPVLRPGEVYSHKFQIEGEFAYFCLLHPAMIGTVVVGGNEER